MVNKAELEAKFVNLYKKEILPTLLQYEKYRKDCFLPTLAIRLILIGLIFAFASPFFKQIGTIFIVSGICLYILDKIIKRGDVGSVDFDIDNTIKEKHMSKFLSIFGEFEWKKGTNMLKDIEQKHIFPFKKNRYKTDDTMIGIYEDTIISIQEIKYNNWQSPLKQTLIYAIGLGFFGLILLIPTSIIAAMIADKFANIINESALAIIVMTLLAICLLVPVLLLSAFVLSSIFAKRCVVISCSLNKQFDTDTYFYEKDKIIKTIPKGFEKVTLEDVNFEEKYLVFSQNQIDARYLLTTAFIERFQNIKTAFKAQYIRGEFINGELILVLGTTKDLFVMGKYSQKTTYKTFVELFEELYSILNLVDHLKLNMKIGL